MQPSHDLDFGRGQLNVREAAQRLGVSRARLYQLLQHGEIASFRVGRRRIVPADAIDSYIRARLQEDWAEPAEPPRPAIQRTSRRPRSQSGAANVLAIRHPPRGPQR